MYFLLFQETPREFSLVLLMPDIWTFTLITRYNPPKVDIYNKPKILFNSGQFVEITKSTFCNEKTLFLTLNANIKHMFLYILQRVHIHSFIFIKQLLISYASVAKKVASVLERSVFSALWLTMCLAMCCIKMAELCFIVFIFIFVESFP